MGADPDEKRVKQSYAEAQKAKKEKQAAAIASSKAGSGSSDIPAFGKMDIRVGKIVKV